MKEHKPCETQVSPSAAGLQAALHSDFPKEMLEHSGLEKIKVGREATNLHLEFWV